MAGLYILMALVAGVGVALQSAVNARLSMFLTSPLHAAAVSFWAGTIVLTTLVLTTGPVVPQGVSLRSIPWIYWIGGGCLGAAFVLMSVFLVPRIGVAAMLVFFIAGQLAFAAVIDQFGFLGVAQQALTPGRIAGLGMVFAGALLVRYA